MKSVLYGKDALLHPQNSHLSQGERFMTVARFAFRFRTPALRY